MNGESEILSWFKRNRLGSGGLDTGAGGVGVTSVVALGDGSGPGEQAVARSVIAPSIAVSGPVVGCTGSILPARLRCAGWTFRRLRQVTSHLDVVFFDVGGPIYGDRPYYQALWKAIQETRPEASESEFWEEFEACRRDQRGPFTRRLAARFVEQDDVDRAIARGHALWEYPPESLQPDVRPTLQALDGTYRIGVLANQQAWIRETLSRDALTPFFDVWVISAEVGVEKPDPRIFMTAVAVAGVPPGRCAMVGDRLDNDMVPARAQGMKGVWLLRGEAPDDPTPEQLSGVDQAIRSLQELPAALDRL
jgi:HAD superfamily hydrolase (TIGR01549 family)